MRIVTKLERLQQRHQERLNWFQKQDFRRKCNIRVSFEVLTRFGVFMNTCHMIPFVHASAPQWRSQGATVPAPGAVRFGLSRPIQAQMIPNGQHYGRDLGIAFLNIPWKCVLSIYNLHQPTQKEEGKFGTPTPFFNSVQKSCSCPKECRIESAQAQTR